MRLTGLLTILWLLALPAAAQTGDGQAGDDNNHAGYYYPPLTSHESYGARAAPLQNATRGTRIGFVTGLTQRQLGQSYAPTFALFAKGDAADKMIIVSIGDHGFRSLYQARGVLAQLTAVARSTSLLQELAMEETFTFFDLARLMGFSRITVSDGETFSHQILLQ